MDPRVFVSMLSSTEEYPIEVVKATVTAEQLARGVDILRTPGNEVTIIDGCVVEHQVWHGAALSAEGAAVRVMLSAGTDFLYDVSAGNQRFPKKRLVTLGSVVHAVARAADAPATTRVVLTISGWSVIEKWLPAVKEALRLMDAS